MKNDEVCAKQTKDCALNLMKMMKMMMKMMNCFLKIVDLKMMNCFIKIVYLKMMNFRRPPSSCGPVRLLLIYFFVDFIMDLARFSYFLIFSLGFLLGFSLIFFTQNRGIVGTVLASCVGQMLWKRCENDEFCIKNEEFCIKNEGSSIKNEECVCLKQ